MNRPAVAVFAALESVLVVGIGVGIPVVALTFLWAFQYGLQVDWSVFWRAGVDVWLIGHGADVTLTLSAATAKATGIAGANAPILVSIAALGFAVLTALLGARAGRRVAETQHRAIGTGVAIGVFAVLSAFVTLTARNPLAQPSLWQGILFPTLVFAVPLVAAAEVARRRRGLPPDPVVAVVGGLLDRVPPTVLTVAGSAIRVGTSAVAAVLAFAGVVIALLLLTHYAQIISLYEGAHAGLLGGLALTIGQISLIPNLVVWAASWLVGSGFALGTGSSVSPLGTSVGPMPAIPFLGALPTGQMAFGFIGILAPVGAAFVIATLLRPRLERLLGPDDTLLVRVLAGVGSGVVAGIVIGFLAAVSGGAAGPGRLVDVGPRPLETGALAALEVALPAVLALVLRQPAWALRDRSLGDLVGRGVRGRGHISPDDQETDVIEPLAAHRSAPAREPASSPGKTTTSQDAIVTERLDDITR
ncbi:cell division protein PerM [Frondihabitans cladoniiphilus]|uniref:Integral membrane protein n=1 Tax=Frondihabitans cladoniiphilus TaxID=715785 RepID=A0ABP8VVW2_9MICO